MYVLFIIKSELYSEIMNVMIVFCVYVCVSLFLRFLLFVNCGIVESVDCGLVSVINFVFVIVLIRFRCSVSVDVWIMV